MTAGPVSASMLRDLWICERRLDLDLHADPAGRDPTSAFVRMLWRDGLAHENEVLAGMAHGAVDLRALPRDELETLTSSAMDARRPLILGAVILHEDLVGMPDLLVLEAAGYVAGDVKSGGATSGPGGAYKTDYLLQVAHYAHILAATGRGAGDAAFIIDAQGCRTDYDLNLPYGRERLPGTQRHLDALAHARAIRDRIVSARGALSAQCGMCDWRGRCRRELAEANDPTLVCGLGRSLRDAIGTTAATVRELAALPRPVPGRATGIRGVGAERLARLIDRAALLDDADAGPVLRAPIALPDNPHAIDFDVEADPSRGIVYLHGFWHERRGEADGTFVHFFAPTPDAAGERAAFAEAIAHFREHRAAHWFHYSAYERTSYRALQRRHPNVCDEAEIDAIFDPVRCTDLYQIVTRSTDWPLGSYSIKSLAKAVGFDWEDADPGGANSIEWYDRHVREGDEALRERIVAYNRDDVIASARVRAALAELGATGRIAAFRRPAR
ncbi:TM0106 family RecB-like putative nuclease [Sphingomonas sp. TX0522]|jgi:predicted RecB family nuclease|uniref:TM0106 family RecB-like putative nuclease n=1 Tax=Sphingomonas sp. TX0522 TaxID=2479205 RepID=UPI0018DFF95E|nr:TM0106 family RecB-like putative nuclease [Sphingomonas sp. TX0522]MBI0532037.1 TM0106 family RecB-like putative nuclease [Sphingomonas sp. TX0522]